MKTILYVLCYFISFVSSQLNFGNDSPSQSKVTFSEENDNILISKIINEEPVRTRFYFGEPKRGESCTTPRGRKGQCRFILEKECSNILRHIRLGRNRQRIIQYLRQAIQPPCGFESHDFTLCCESFNAGPVTNRPTTSTTSLSPQVQCGRSVIGKRIVGGIQATPGSWPWAVVLGRKEDNIFRVICGGTLISPTHVLTAAHCFPGGSNPVIEVARLGEHNVLSDNDGASPVDVEIDAIILHEEFDLQKLVNDIALVKLKRSVDLTPNIHAACLPHNFVRFDYSRDLRDEPSIIGWGSTEVDAATTDILRQARVPVSSLSACQSAYESVRRVSITDSHICAGNEDRDSCSGDSGGPMLTRHDGSWTVIGITSFGIECARAEYPGVYTRVDKYLNWIQRNS